MLNFFNLLHVCAHPLLGNLNLVLLFILVEDACFDLTCDIPLYFSNFLHLSQCFPNRLLVVLKFSASLGELLGRFLEFVSVRCLVFLGVPQINLHLRLLHLESLLFLFVEFLDLGWRTDVQGGLLLHQKDVFIFFHLTLLLLNLVAPRLSSPSAFRKTKLSCTT